MAYIPVSLTELAAMDGLEHWGVFVDGALRTEFMASSFAAAGELVMAFAAEADNANHHPDIMVRYPGRVEVSLSTHAIDGLSMHDVELARSYSQMASERGALPYL